MGTRYGTSHFVSRAAAINYYDAYGNDVEEVDRKLVDGEIHIGRPTAPDGCTVYLDNIEGRYIIADRKA